MPHRRVLFYANRRRRTRRSYCSIAVMVPMKEERAFSRCSGMQATLNSACVKNDDIRTEKFAGY